MTKIVYQIGKKIIEPAEKSIPKTANKIIEIVEHCSAPQAISDGSLLRSYNGIKGHSEKLFKTLEEFTQSVRKHFVGYKDTVPDRLYQLIEKNIQDNNFEFSKILKEYYSELNNCKTMEEVHKLYPEFKSVQLKPVETIKNELKAMLPENICRKIHNLKTYISLN